MIVASSHTAGLAAHTAATAPADGEAPLRILHLVAPCEAGGLERVVHALAIGHRRRGHDARVAAIFAEEEEHAFLQPLRDAGVPVHSLLLPGRGYLRERRSVAALLRELQPDVLHTHGYRPNVVDTGVARKLGVATISTVHGFTGGDWKNRLYERLERLALRRLDAVVPVSRPLAELLRSDGVASERLHLLPNAWFERQPPLGRVEAREELRVPEGTFHLGWVGRLGHEKGLDLLIEALPHLADLPLVLSVLGDGREREPLTARAAELGVGERIRWHGTVPEAGRFFPSFDAFVLSSRTEGTPIVLFEAMAAGAPIVATRVGGVPDVVTGAEALLVPPEDPMALAAALRTVQRDPAAAAERARAARERLQREYGSEPWLDRYEAIYRQLRSLRQPRMLA